MPLAVNDKYLKLNQLLLSTIGFIQAICEFFFLDRLRYSKMQKIKNSFYKKKPVHYLSKQGCVITRKKKPKHKGVCWKPKKNHYITHLSNKLIYWCFVTFFLFTLKKVAQVEFRGRTHSGHPHYQTSTMCLHADAQFLLNESPKRIKLDSSGMIKVIRVTAY